VDLDDVEAELLQVGEAGMAGAGVVERNARAQRLDAADDRLCALDAGERLAIGDLEDELLEGDLRVPEQRLDVAHGAQADEVRVEEVEADFQILVPPERVLEVAACLLHEVYRHRLDQAGRLGVEDKAARWDYRAVGLPPAHQHLAADEPAGGDFDDRLVVRDELVALDAAAQFCDLARRSAEHVKEKRKDQD